MGINWRKVVGVGTIAGVLGLTAYAIILYKREQKKDEESISLEEAMDLVENMSPIMTDKGLDNDISKVAEENMDSKRIIQDLIDNNNTFLKDLNNDIDSYDGMVVARRSEDVERENEEEDEKLMEEELREELPILEPEPILLEDEGEGKLRYDPNSDEALIQFMRMELADWVSHEEEYRTLEELFDIAFEPIVDGDIYLHQKLVDYRGEFFGPASRWVLRVSFADLILHFARLSDYNLGGGVRYWVNHFLDINNISARSMSDHHMEYMLGLMNSHDFYIKDTNDEFQFTLFGLNNDDIRRAKAVAAKNIDNSLTYEIEFNEFLMKANNHERVE